MLLRFLALVLIAFSITHHHTALAAEHPRRQSPPAGEPTSAHALGPEAEAALEALLASMSLRDKAAQMIMPWVPGGMLPGSAEYRRIERLVTTQRVGGVIVGKGDGGRTTRALRNLQQRSRLPLLVASDLEWGAGMRLEGATLLPTAMGVAATGDSALAWLHGVATAVEARAAGIHVAFAPVFDVNVNPRNPIINTRAFGEDPATVARFGTAAVRGMQAGGLLAVAKHFPGHGDTDQDSHLTLPVIRASRERLRAVELPPFQAAVDAGVDGVMVAHLAVPALTGDRTPASLSHAVTTGLLRRDMRFEGLIFTDALNMAGVGRIASEAPQLALRAVKAGADILLQPTAPELAIDAIEEAVQRGEVSQDRIDASVRRILRAKALAGLLDEADGVAGARERADLAGLPSPAQVADSIAARAMTLVRDSSTLLPIGRRPVLSLVYAGVTVLGGPNATFESVLRQGGVTVQRRSLTARRAGALADSLLAAWGRDATPPLVVVASYSQAVPWQGVIGLPAPAAAAVERIARRADVVHVVFGDPYAAASVPSASTILLGWSGVPATQRAAARVLLGEAAVSGTLPVSISPAYPAGAGMRLEPAADHPR